MSSDQGGANEGRETHQGSSQPIVPPPPLSIPYAEFVALLAMLMAMTALSIDIMLPVLPEIAKAFGITTRNDQQLVIGSYLGGLALGQLLWGSVSDRLGRKGPLLFGLGVFMLGGIAAVWVSSFEHLTAARFLQGFGGAAARIVAVAVIRDHFSGRQMARVLSTVMMVFILVPVLAPSIGQAAAGLGSWRTTFHVLIGVGALAIVWAGLRLPETHDRTRTRLGAFASLRLVFTTRVTVAYAIAAGFMFGCLVTYISSAQQVFVDVFGLGTWFPVVFGAIASAIAVASFGNSRLVQRIGMRRLSHSALVAFTVVATTLAILAETAQPPLVVVAPLLAACFFLFGVIQPNFNAIAMHPVGQAAGTAASLIGAYTTAAGAIFGTLIARQFDGSVLPLSAGFALLGICALLTVFAVEGRSGMFRGE